MLGKCRACCSMYNSNNPWLYILTLAKMRSSESLTWNHLSSVTWQQALAPSSSTWRYVWSMWSVLPYCVSQTSLLLGKMCGLLLDYSSVNDIVVVPASVSQVRWLLMPKNNRITNFHTENDKFPLPFLYLSVNKNRNVVNSISLLPFLLPNHVSPGGIWTQNPSALASTCWNYSKEPLHIAWLNYKVEN